MLYTDYVFLFQTAGLILLVAMIGAIVLTLRDRKTSRHQDIRRQTERTVAETLTMMSVSVGAGTTPSGGYLRPKEPDTGRGTCRRRAGGPNMNTDRLRISVMALLVMARRVRAREQGLRAPIAQGVWSDGQDRAGR